MKKKPNIKPKIDPDYTSGSVTNATRKLKHYADGDRQPARDLFKAVRIFDRRQLPRLSKTFADLLVQYQTS